VSASGRVARNAGFRMGGEIIAKVGSLAFYVTMARQLGTEGFGAFQFALALTTALAYLAGFGTDALLARETARDPARAPRLLADAVAIKSLGGLVMVGVALLVVTLGDYSATEHAAVAIVGIGSVLELMSKSWFSIFQGYERLDLVSLVLIAQRFSTAIVGIVILLAGGGVLAAGAVYAAGAALAVVLSEVTLRRLGVRRAPAGRSRWPALVRAGIPIGAISLLMTLLLRVDVTMLSFLTDVASVGIYAVAYRLVEATQFLGSALAAAMLPWLARAHTDTARGFALGLRAVVALLAPIALGFLLFAGPLIALLYGPRFAAARVPLQLMSGVTLMYGINAFTGIALIARDRPLAYAKLIGPVLVINVGLNVVLIPRYGADGAAFNALLSSVLLAALALREAHRVLGRVDLVDAFASPAAGCALMAATVLALRLPWIAEAVLGGVAYAVGLLACEWLMSPDDARRVLAALASRRRAGRSRA
jgi:O-antigen/teichoic acid export membrane protein